MRPSPEQVVREHGPTVHRQLERIFGPHADVDDVFQNVFIEVLRSLPSLCHGQNAIPPDSLYAFARFLDDKGFGASANSETKAFQL